jgi:hypothetical protein
MILNQYVFQLFPSEPELHVLGIHTRWVARHQCDSRFPFDCRWRYWLAYMVWTCHTTPVTAAVQWRLGALQSSLH